MVLAICLQRSGPVAQKWVKFIQEFGETLNRDSFIKEHARSIKVLSKYTPRKPNYVKQR